LYVPNKVLAAEHNQAIVQLYLEKRKERAWNPLRANGLKTATENVCRKGGRHAVGELVSCF